MPVLVINCGSSSLKVDLVDPDTGAHLASARVERIGKAGGTLRLDGGSEEALEVADHAAALEALWGRLPLDGVKAVGHRVVHGGSRFSAPARINEEVEAAIEALIPLAPLHNPANLAGIRAARAHLPDLPHVAVFDTAFHATLPHRAWEYALPAELRERHSLRRYGFHGPSHAWVSRQAAAWLEEDPRDLRIITLHLGNGASACAVEYGRSVETSMGMTPLEGLVMGTRSGDVDPGILLDLMRAEGLDADGLDALLNGKSGLAGLSGRGNDMRDIEARAAEGDEACRLALQVSCHRIRKYIGAYAAVMGGVDAIVFTGGIGENSVGVRHRVAQRLEFLGARLDEEANRAARVDTASPIAEINASHSRCRLLVVATDEAMEIGREAARLAGEADKVSPDAIPIAVSARHIHLTQEAVEQLFGPGHTLTVKAPISQPGQFACEEQLTIVGPRRSMERVRVIGPTRPKCQIEISRTDEFALGIDAPVRDSGDVAQSPGIRLVGPAGSLDLTEGVICARRHIHMAPEDALRFGVKDRDVVEVGIDSQGRDLTFGDVLVRVSPKYLLEMHLDTDEANAAEIRSGDRGVLAATERLATLRRRSVAYDG